MELSSYNTKKSSHILQKSYTRSTFYLKNALLFEVKLLMGRDERELFFVHSILLDHFRVILSDRFVFIHNSNIDLIVYIFKVHGYF